MGSYFVLLVAGTLNVLSTCLATANPSSTATAHVSITVGNSTIQYKHRDGKLLHHEVRTVPKPSLPALLAVKPYAPLASSKAVRVHQPITIPSYKPVVTYAPHYNIYEPVYSYPPKYLPEKHSPKPIYHKHEHIPKCASKSNASWCLQDSEYPKYEIESALQYHKDHVLSLYADVANLNTELSVERPERLEDETYLCSSKVSYILPLRAINTDGKWRVIVNNIQIHYEKLSQTTRLEECQTTGDPCPLVPFCYGSKCLQKKSYRKFLVFDPYDAYFPFAVESFRMPSSCVCFLNAYKINNSL